MSAPSPPRSRSDAVYSEGDESESYWGFCTIMERMKGNFLRDQSGMQAQLCELQGLIAIMDPLLYAHLGEPSFVVRAALIRRTEKTASLNLFFCFRWILCSFKRELSFEDTTKLWEILWTDQYGPKFHLFFALAIIEQHRDVIMRYLQEFDEVRFSFHRENAGLTVADPQIHQRVVPNAHGRHSSLGRGDSLPHFRSGRFGCRSSSGGSARSG